MANGVIWLEENHQTKTTSPKQAIIHSSKVLGTEIRYHSPPMLGHATDRH